MPAILDIDFVSLTVIISFIPGAVLRESFAQKGAIVRDRDVADHDAFTGLTTHEIWLRRIEQGRRHLLNIVDPSFIDALFQEMTKMHAAKVLWGDVKYGNVVKEKFSAKPYIIDYDAALVLPGLHGDIFRLVCDRDIDMFNLHFDTQHLTYQSIIAKVAATASCYAPIYLGSGIRMGSVWNRETGEACWHFLLKSNLPPLKGARIVDLGANNAFNALQYLRAGALEVTAIELNQKEFEQGLFLHNAIQWRDKRSYNLNYINADIRDILSMDLGPVDFVSALCCLYYLDDEMMYRIIGHVGTITDTLVLQCNTDKNINRNDSHTYEKASVEFNVAALKANGFPHVKIVAPYRYNRPLLIGTKAG